MFFIPYRQKLQKRIGKTICELQLGGWNILNISPLIYFEERTCTILSNMKFLSSFWYCQHFCAP